MIDSVELTPDYGLQLEELIDQCEFGYVDKDILQETFSFLTVPKKEKIKIYIWRFRSPVLSDTVIKYFDRAGMATASIRDLLTFGYTFPKYQEKAPVVALYPAQNVRGGEYMIPMIEKDTESLNKIKAGANDGGKRGLLLVEWAGFWRLGTAFLAVRKNLRVIQQGEIKFDQPDLTPFLVDCQVEKDLKKLDLTVPADKKGKTFKYFLINSSSQIKYPDLLRKVKKINNKFRPGNLFDLIAAKDTVLRTDIAVIATGTMAGQTDNRFPMVTGPDCRLEVIGVSNDFRFGPEISFLFALPGAKK